MERRQLQAHFNKSEGRLDILDARYNKLCSLGFSHHLKDWAVKPVSRTNGFSWAKKSVGEGFDVCYTQVNGNNTVIEIQTIVGQDANNNFVVEIEVRPQNLNAVEDFCSIRLSLYLYSTYFEGGFFDLQSRNALPAPGTTMKEGCKLFTEPPSSRVDSCSKFSFQSKSGVHLSVSTDTPTVLNCTDIRQWAPIFDIRIGEVNNFQLSKSNTYQCKATISGSSSSPLVSHSLSSLTPKLSPTDIQHFKSQGYLLLRNLIPKPQIENALRLINKSIGTHGLTKENVEKHQFCHDIANDAIITGLVKYSPILSILESQFLGVGNVPEIWGAQIALRFPVGDPDKITPVEHTGRHIDGYSVPGKVHNFNILVGVYLNDVEGENRGNLALFPESHIAAAEYFKSNDPVTKANGGHLPITVKKPVQMEVKAGDVIFSHYLTSHTVAVNVSPHVRYALYFRIKAKSADGDNGSFESMKNLFRDFKAF
eukprot:TRINITY_DN3067_c0_g1_i1.p1 TRINITY_DN3067_c0_g1~~TRINITY_DN3067_c0_g1_i1.p1  ORF type:complete len:480 (-),score=92.18 TRINITY_DN3067_c0_g1_i1:55-1494(-)